MVSTKRCMNKFFLTLDAVSPLFQNICLLVFLGPRTKRRCRKKVPKGVIFEEKKTATRIKMSATLLVQGNRLLKGDFVGIFSLHIVRPRSSFFSEVKSPPLEFPFNPSKLPFCCAKRAFKRHK